MKVIEKSEMEPWSLRVTCMGSTTPSSPPGCRSLLEIGLDDLTRIAVYEDKKYKGERAVFTCPCCMGDTDIAKGNLPSWVFNSIKPGESRGAPQMFSGKE